jgi:hypothetical protein
MDVGRPEDQRRVNMTLIAYGGFMALVGLALFGSDPVAAGIAVFVGVSLAALGHTSAAGSEENRES